MRIVFASILFLALSTSGQAADCLSYEPAKQVLKGKIIPRTYPRSINYGALNNNDFDERVWVVQLSAPVCVDASQDSINESEKDVSELQLVMKKRYYKKYRYLLNDAVEIEGSLFHAHTAHHHTPVLLTVSKIKAAKGEGK